MATMKMVSKQTALTTSEGSMLSVRMSSSDCIKINFRPKSAEGFFPEVKVEIDRAAALTITEAIRTWKSMDSSGSGFPFVAISIDSGDRCSLAFFQGRCDELSFYLNYETAFHFMHSIEEVLKPRDVFYTPPAAVETSAAKASRKGRRK